MKNKSLFLLPLLTMMFFGCNGRQAGNEPVDPGSPETSTTTTQESSSVTNPEQSTGTSFVPGSDLNDYTNTLTIGYQTDLYLLTNEKLELGFTNSKSSECNVRTEFVSGDYNPIDVYRMTGEEQCIFKIHAKEKNKRATWKFYSPIGTELLSVNIIVVSEDDPNVSFESPIPIEEVNSNDLPLEFTIRYQTYSRKITIEGYQIQEIDAASMRVSLWKVGEVKGNLLCNFYKTMDVDTDSNPRFQLVSPPTKDFYTSGENFKLDGLQIKDKTTNRIYTGEDTDNIKLNLTKADIQGAYIIIKVGQERDIFFYNYLLFYRDVKEITTNIPCFDPGSEPYLDKCLLTVTYNDSRTELISLNNPYLEHSEVSTSEIGLFEYTFKYHGYSGKGQYIVSETTYAVANQPTKTHYHLGETFDPTGLRVSIYYHYNGETEYIEGDNNYLGFSVTVFDSVYEEVDVYYWGSYCGVVNVTVDE